MIADLKPYAECKESGLPWLGDIPQHWATERAKWLFTKMDRPVREEDEVVTCFRDGMVTLRKNRRLRGFTEATVYSGYQGIRKGDLVIHGMDAFAGAIGVSDSDGKGTPVYNVCQPRSGANASYYAQLVRQMSQSQWILALAKGIRERSTDFRFEMFGNQRVSLPPPAEQASIVRFLDWANGRLERAIRAKRKVIALLNEQKQAMIHRAVTQGLDPSVLFRPSGIPWLGDIPQHWEVRKLKHCVSRIEQGWSPQCDAQPAGENEWGVLKVGCVNKDSFSPQQNKKLPASLQPNPSLEVRDGDVLVSRANTRELLGLAALAENPPAKRIVCDKLFRFRAKGDCFTSRFLVFALRAKPCRVQIESSTNGASSSMQNIGQGVLKNLWVSMPAVPEQDRIVEHIAVATQPVSTALSRLEREIELLREYRTRLVADVVTGKLDVHEAAARLPDEAQPDTAEGDTDLIDETESADEEAAV
jgi:type I restriction enzyme S subunit